MFTVSSEIRMAMLDRQQPRVTMTQVQLTILDEERVGTESLGLMRLASMLLELPSAPSTWL